MLRLERLEARDVPATLFDPTAWEAGTLERWVGNPGGVDWHITTAEFDDGHRNVVYAGAGGGARVVVVNKDGTGPESDRVFFDQENWRGGVGDVTWIGSTLYVTPGFTPEHLPGPVYGKIDLATGATSEHFIPGFEPEWRGGSQVVAVDVDWRPDPDGNGSTHPEKELVFLPGGTETVLPGNVFFIVNSADDTLRSAVGWGDPDVRRRYEFAPAGVGVMLRPAIEAEFVGYGMTLQEVGTEPDPRTWTVARTWSVTFDGSAWFETSHDTGAFGAGAEEYAAAFPELGIYVG